MSIISEHGQPDLWVRMADTISEREEEGSEGGQGGEVSRSTSNLAEALHGGRPKVGQGEGWNFQPGSRRRSTRISLRRSRRMSRRKTQKTGGI